MPSQAAFCLLFFSSSAPRAHKELATESRTPRKTGLRYELLRCNL